MCGIRDFRGNVVVFAGGHALAAKGVADVVKFVVGVFALLQPVNHSDHLRLQRERTSRFCVRLRVEVGLHLSRFAAEQTGIKL